MLTDVRFLTAQEYRIHPYDEDTKMENEQWAYAGWPPH